MSRIEGADAVELAARWALEREVRERTAFSASHRLCHDCKTMHRAATCPRCDAFAQGRPWRHEELA